MDAGYGLYKFSIWSVEQYPVVGSPTTTIIGATLTTAPIITSTSSSYSLISTSSSSSYSAITTSSSTLSTSAYYTNGTSTSSSVYGTATGSLTTTASDTGSTIVPVVSATSTKPAGTSAPPSSGAGIVKASGFSLMAVAGVFVWLM